MGADLHMMGMWRGDETRELVVMSETWGVGMGLGVVLLGVVRRQSVGLAGKTRMRRLIHGTGNGEGGGYAGMIGSGGVGSWSGWGVRMCASRHGGKRGWETRGQGTCRLVGGWKGMHRGDGNGSMVGWAMST